MSEDREVRTQMLGGKVYYHFYREGYQFHPRKISDTGQEYFDIRYYSGGGFVDVDYSIGTASTIEAAKKFVDDYLSR